MTLCLHRARRVLLCLIIAWAAGLGQENTGFASNGVPVNFAAVGRQRFTQKKYDEAIDYFRKHLRRAPRDYNIWNQLGAAYYHTGQPRRALRYLKHVERRTIDKSYNYYYQGLCYIAVEQQDKAREYLTFAAQRFTDEYASRSTFELAAIEYNARNKPRANYWLAFYMQRYPTGVYAPQAGRMLQSLREDKWLDDIEGTKKPDMEEALFKYNQLSLHPKPHYWFAQAGWRYVEHSGMEPKPGGGIGTRAFSDMAGIANAGVGAGPWREGDMTLFGGYTYRQLWITEQDRIDTWLDEPTDFEYLPLRGDLLERRHQAYADFRRDIMKTFYFGIYFRYELARIGSTLFPSPDNEDLQKVMKMSDTQLLIPWIGTAWNPTMRTLAYLYMRKEINEDSPEHSNKTYELGMGGGGGAPVFSLGISHDMEFPEQQLSVGFELFRYEFIYNDYWLDYKREGLLLTAEHEFLPRWFVNGLFGYYQDEYLLPRIKTGACGSAVDANEAQSTGGETPPTDTAPASKAPNQCPRNDTGMMYQAGVYYNWTQFQRFSGYVQFVENRNAQQREFDESKQSFVFTFTMAFPSVKRVSRFVDRFADTAFTKQAE